MESGEKSEKLTPYARWLLVIPAACLSSIATLAVLAVWILMTFPAFWQMHGGLYISGAMVAGFVWGGAMTAPIRHWVVGLLLILFAMMFLYAIDRQGILSELPQRAVGGLLGMGLVRFTVWYAPILKKVQARNKVQGERIVAYLKKKRSEGMSLPSLAWLFIQIESPFKFLKPPEDAPLRDYSNPFGLNREEP